MYDDIGNKLEKAAIVLFIISAIAAVIGGMILAYECNILLGLLVACLGILLSLIFSWLIYGFGEMLNKTNEIVRNTLRTHHTPLQKQTTTEKQTIKTTIDNETIDEIK